jgi:hypothetical protein
MRYLFLLLGLLFVPGCEGVFDDAMKDFRGDNMQMRGFSSGMADPPIMTKPAAQRSAGEG